MSEQALEARSSDTGKLKHDGITYIPRNPGTDVIQPPITKKMSKADRGFNHPVIARLLVPRHMRDEFDEVDSTYAYIQL